MMKQLKLTLIAVFALVTVGSVSAQEDESHPWIFGLGINVIDYANSDALVKDYFGRDDWDASKFFSRISAGKYIGDGFTINAAFSFNEITDFGDGVPVEYSYFSLDVNAQYDLNELFGDTSWFDPYAYAGAGYNYLDGDEKLRGMTLNFGVGMNFWTGDNFAINYQTGMKVGLGDNLENHFQHSLGVILKIGGSSDD